MNIQKINADILIISSFNIIYDKMKLIQIKNINNFMSNKLENFNIRFIFVYNSIEICKKLDFIFEKQDNYYNLYINDKENFENIINKTWFYFKEIYNDNIDFLLKTNLSTLFDFDKLFSWYTNIYINNINNKILCGTILKNAEKMFISGTNMIISKNILLLLKKNVNKFINNSEYYSKKIENIYTNIEDESISNIILSFKNITLINIPRIDFVNNLGDNKNFFYINSFHKNDIINNIFCYRCKDVLNRNNDILNMKKIILKIQYNLYNQFLIYNEDILNYIINSKKSLYNILNNNAININFFNTNTYTNSLNFDNKHIICDVFYLTYQNNFNFNLLLRYYNKINNNYILFIENISIDLIYYIMNNISQNIKNNINIFHIKPNTNIENHDIPNNNNSYILAIIKN